jgi:FUSC-like inner membrane protein yccS
MPGHQARRKTWREPVELNRARLKKPAISSTSEDPMTNLHDRTGRLREAVVPGRLAEAMPDWLTEAVRPKPAPVPWGAMVRAALAVCVPLAVGIVAGRRDIWLLLAIGGLTGTVIDTSGPYVMRVKRAVIAGVFGGGAGLVIGMLIHNRGWVAVASLVVVAGVSALISRLGSTASVAGLQLLVFAALGLGPFGALRPWWHVVLGYAAGIAWALLLLVPGWLRSPRSAEQSAVADVYHALADDLRNRHRPRRADSARGHGRAQQRVRHPAHRAGDGRRPKPAHDAPDGDAQRQFPGARGGRHASP